MEIVYPDRGNAPEETLVSRGISFTSFTYRATSSLAPMTFVSARRADKNVSRSFLQTPRFLERNDSSDIY